MTVDAAWWGAVLANDSAAFFPTGRETDRAADETYLLLPGRGDPRVVVDASSVAALRDSIDRMASRALPGVARRLVPLGSKIAERMGSSWSIVQNGGEPTLRQHLSEILRREVVLSVAVGPPRLNRKPVVRCFDGADMVAVAKLGPEAHTQALVCNEARWLEAFDDSPLETATTARLLHGGTYGRSALVVMSALPLASEVPGSIGDMPSAVLSELIDRTGTTLGIGYSGFWSQLEARLDGNTLPIVHAAVASVVDDPASGRLPVSFWHGDWSPWNVGRARDGRLCVWDWERSSTTAPVGFDLLHLHHQYGSSLEEGVDALVDSGRPPEEASLLRRLYLLELVARHDEAGATTDSRYRAVIDLLAS